MIEILILFQLGPMIAARARRQGRSGFQYVLLLLGLWFGGEIGGAVLGMVVSLLLDPMNEPNLLLIYVGSLAGASGGAVMAFRMVNAKPPIQWITSRPVTMFGANGRPPGETAPTPVRPTAEAWAKIYPYIVPAPYVENQPTYLDGYIRPLGHDVQVMLMHDLGALYGNVQPEEIEAAGLTFSQAHALALDNLQKLAESGAMSQHLMFVNLAAVPADFLDSEAAGSWQGQVPFVLWTGHPLAASCLLIPNLYSWAQKQLGSDDILASIPQRENLLLFPKGDAHFRGVMRRTIQQAESQAIKLITFEWFTLTANTMEPFVEPRSFTLTADTTGSLVEPPTSIKTVAERGVREPDPLAPAPAPTDALTVNPGQVKREELIASIAGPGSSRPPSRLGHWLIGVVILLCAGVWIAGFALKKETLKDPFPRERLIPPQFPWPAAQPQGK